MSEILLTSDLHGRLDGLDEMLGSVDIAVIAGDFADLHGRGKWHIYDQKKWVEKKFIPLLEKHSNVDFVIVPGNHDFCMDVSICEKLFAGEKDMSIKWPSNAHILLDTGCKVKGLKFYGSPWVPIISYSWAFEAENAKLAEKFNKIPEGLDFLVTHSPPSFGHLCDIDKSLQTDSPHFGSHELAQAIIDKKPKYAICGHIHTGDHASYNIEGTMVFNVSRLDERYEIAFQPLHLSLNQMT